MWFRQLRCVESTDMMRPHSGCGGRPASCSVRGHIEIGRLGRRRASADRRRQRGKAAASPLPARRYASHQPLRQRAAILGPWQQPCFYTAVGARRGVLTAAAAGGCRHRGCAESATRATPASGRCKSSRAQLSAKRADAATHLPPLPRRCGSRACHFSKPERPWRCVVPAVARAGLHRTTPQLRQLRAVTAQPRARQWGSGGCGGSMSVGRRGRRHSRSDATRPTR